MNQPPLSFFSDIHTHGEAAPDVIKSIEPADDLTGEYGSAWYSVGVHPWSTVSPVDQSVIDELYRKASDPRVVAIGEAGLDKKRGGSAEYQEKIFLLHADLAERLRKPLIIHCVGRYGRIIQLRDQLKPSQKWIIHGFTGKPELARQLLSAGFDISLGRRFNPEVKSVIPVSRLYRESD